MLFRNSATIRHEKHLLGSRVVQAVTKKPRPKSYRDANHRYTIRSTSLDGLSQRSITCCHRLQERRAGCPGCASSIPFSQEQVLIALGLARRQINTPLPPSHKPTLHRNLLRACASLSLRIRTNRNRAKDVFWAIFRQ